MQRGIIDLGYILSFGGIFVLAAFMKFFFTKAKSKDKSSKFKKNDFAMGYDLSITGLMQLFLVAVLKTDIDVAYMKIVLVMFLIFFCALIGISYFIRLYGYSGRERKIWGIILENSIGIIIFGSAMRMVTEL